MDFTLAIYLKVALIIFIACCVFLFKTDKGMNTNCIICLSILAGVFWLPGIIVWCYHIFCKRIDSIRNKPTLDTEIDTLKQELQKIGVET